MKDANDKKTDSYFERKLIIGLIKSKEFIEQIQPLLKIKWLKNEESKRIAAWCIRYFKKYNEAPNEAIQDIYMKEAEKLKDETAALIEETLFSLSDEFESDEFDTDHFLDICEEYLKRRQIEYKIEDIKVSLDSNNLEDAISSIEQYERITRIKANYVIPLGTSEQIYNAFSLEETGLYTYGNTPLGNLMNNALKREGFVVIMAQNKGGKTFFLMDGALRAARQGLNVLFYQAGDMSQKGMERRIGIYYTRRSDLAKYCGLQYIPVLDCVYNQTGDCPDCLSDCKPFEDYSEDVIRWECKDKDRLDYGEMINIVDDFYEDHKPCYECIRSGNFHQFKGSIWYKKRKPVDPLTWKNVYHIVKKKYKKILNRLRLITYSNDSLTVSQIKAEIDIMKKTEGFVPDVVFIDYMDILEAEPYTKTMPKRDQENVKWQMARKLAQEINGLVFSATQADAKSFDSKLLSRANFSEDKRKLDHVTAMYGLNMDKWEKRKGVYRINDIVTREDLGDEIVYTTNRLQIGRPILNSFF